MTERRQRQERRENAATPDGREVKPVAGPRAQDWMGNWYETEELPPTATEGDTCEISFSGNSGWYQAGYVWRSGGWVEQWTSAPWQMFV